MTQEKLVTSKPDRYKASSFRAYNCRLTEHYDTLYWLRVFRVREWDHAIAECLRPHLASSPVLDVGCASGRLLEVLAKQGAAHLCGVDIAPRILEKAREKLEPLGIRYELRAADVEEALQWPDSFFGAAILCGVIHHFFRPRDALAQIHRVLQPGGCLVVAEPGFPIVVRQVLNGYMRLFPHDGDCRFYSPRQLIRILDSSGFASVGAPKRPIRFSYMVVFSKRASEGTLRRPEGAQPDAAPEPPPDNAVRDAADTMNPKPESKAPAEGDGW